MNEEQVAGIVERQREHFRSNATLPLEARRQALRALLDAVRAHEDDIVAALAADLGKSRDESYMCEIGLSLSEIRHQLSHVARWMRPRRHATDLANAVASSRTIRVPYGVTLVMAPWNYPFLLTLEPLAGALAAGNTVVVKPSAYAPASSAVLRAICEEAFHPELVSVVEGGRAENAALGQRRERRAVASSRTPPSTMALGLRLHRQRGRGQARQAHRAICPHPEPVTVARELTSAASPSHRAANLTTPNGRQDPARGLPALSPLASG